MDLAAWAGCAAALTLAALAIVDACALPARRSSRRSRPRRMRPPVVHVVPAPTPPVRIEVTQRQAYAPPPEPPAAAPPSKRQIGFKVEESEPPPPEASRAA